MLSKRLAAKRLRGTVVAPVLVLAIYLPVLVLHSVATSQVQRLDPPRVEVRDFGNPGRALRRVRESNVTTVAQLDALATDAGVAASTRQVFANAPVLVETPGMFSMSDDSLIGLYYTVSIDQVESTTMTTIRYFLYYTGERQGTPLRVRMARYGQPFDGELLYELDLLNDRVFSAQYQAPMHRLLKFAHQPSSHPAFAVASLNHNFRLARPGEGPLVALMPQNETASDPFHDPDYVALAAQQTLTRDNLDISHYVYVDFENPAPNVPVDISIRVRGQWFHLHDVINDGDVLGGSYIVEGYHQVAIDVGFTPLPDDIDEVRVIARAYHPVQLAVSDLFLYPEPRITL